MQQHRSITDSAVEIRADGDTKTISGYAAVFNSLSNNLGGFRETIAPDAFARSLKEIKAGTRAVSARIQHDGGLSTIGTTANGSLQLSVDATGLRYDIVEPPDTTAARDIMTLVDGGYISKSSFAFQIPEGGASWDFATEPPTQRLLDVDLIDVAPVDGPAYEATTVEARSETMARMEADRPKPNGPTVAQRMMELNKLRL